MALTLATIRNHVMAMIDRDDSDTSSKVTDYINITGRDIWKAHPWNERQREASVITLDDYSTGTVTVTKASATVTGSGTTFPATIVNGRTKFSLGFGQPAYLIATRDSATQLTLVDAYCEATQSGATYVVYTDLYEVDSACDTILDVALAYGTDGGPLSFALERRMDELAFQPGSGGRPVAWCMKGPNSSTGVKRIRLWPAPDDTYRLRYRYMTDYTDMSADGDVCVVPESRRDLLICGTLRWAYRLSGDYQKAMAEEQKFAAMLRTHWERERVVESQGSRLRPFDSGLLDIRGWDINTIGNS